MHIEIASENFRNWSALLTLLHECYAYMDARIDPPSSLTGMTENDLRAKAQRECLIVAHESDQLVGCAYADIRRTCVYVGKVAVATTARNRGVARQLMAAAESVARRSGQRVLELQTRIELLENQRAFAALGFKAVAETAHAGYLRPTSITMQRVLSFTPQ